LVLCCGQDLVLRSGPKLLAKLEILRKSSALWDLIWLCATGRSAKQITTVQDQFEKKILQLSLKGQ
jgi:hypothetical protein